MLKKLAKLLGNAKNGLHSTPGSNPTPPPPPLYQHSYSLNNGTMQKNNQQQQLTFNPYVDEMEDHTDNMSLYSTTASIMTSRNHPRNNSQRPLLGERKPQLLLQLSSSNNNSNNSSNNNKNITGGNVKKYKYHATTTANQQQPCPKYQQRKAHQQEQQLQQQQLEASYISPYVQQQKRDSAKGLHGFNDFDILSQQYNTHLQSPHIGYPYGSPPSPHSSNVDFVFDTVESSARITTKTTTLTTKTTTTTTTTRSKSTHFGLVNNYGSMLMSEVNAVDYIAASDAINKFSRFEDDFCNRRNKKFAANDVKCNEILVTDENRQTIQTGPFIFGIPPEQQTNPTRLPNHDDICINVTQTDDANNYSPKDTHTKFNSWDTSSLAPDDASSDTNDSSTREQKSVRKFLLKKFCKKKKTTKAHILSKLIDKASIKCVVVGDCAVGKTNLILSYLENRFNVEHVPTASDIYNADVMVDDNPVHLTLCDTAGQDTLDPLRELCYPDSDVFLLCFSVAKPDTFHAIKTKWAPKFAKTKAALILVGTQADLRHNANVLNKLQSNGEKPISYADAWDLATTIGAKYIETSSATQYKVKEVFDTAIWDGLVPEALPAPPPSLWKKLFCLA